MCNLYSVTKGQAAILEAYRAMMDRTGNLPPLPGVFPDYPTPMWAVLYDRGRTPLCVSSACPASSMKVN